MVEEKIIEKTVKIPYLQTIQIVDKCEIVVEKVITAPMIKEARFQSIKNRDENC